MSGFATFDDYLAHPRVTDLALSPDGSRLLATVAQLAEDGAKLVSALWEIDPSGTADAARLTRSSKGESGPALHPDGRVLFVSARDADDDEPAALWVLPPVGRHTACSPVPAGCPACAWPATRERCC